MNDRTIAGRGDSLREYDVECGWLNRGETMDERENPYSAPLSSLEESPRPPARGIARALVTIAVAVAIVVALLWMAGATRWP